VLTAGLVLAGGLAMVRGWHATTTADRARGGEVARAISPSPKLTRAQLDAWSPGRIVNATLNDRPGRVRHAKKPRPLSFGLTTFNVLGSQHTAPGGDAIAYAPGRIRTQWLGDLLGGLGSTVIGLQEMQRDQLLDLNTVTGGQYTFWPGEALGGAGIPQSLMWRSSEWKAKDLDYIVVPFMDSTRPQPVVLLKHRRTKQKIYVLNIHNSPKDKAGRQGERNKAMRIEVKAVRKLRRDGYPVFIVGDFNDHAKAFCKMTERTGLKAASGGSHPRKGKCQPPSNMRVDWIFGSRTVDFSGFRMDAGPLFQRVTDHTVLSTKVAVR
jgi:endonuclease/exonuclease/phosphatase family metal-dependent hydrolase